jgi:2-C-methyl-D-erythritol 4-phosphate cytidylyltransferase
MRQFINKFGENCRMQTYAVIVAGGSGTRMGADVPKQFLHIHDIPVFIHTLKAFREALPNGKIVLVLPKAHLDTGANYIHQFLPGSGIKIVEGGETRFHSVKNGLAEVKEDSIVFIHDAVRCMVTSDLIHRCQHDAELYGSSIPVVEVRDSVRRLTGSGSEVVDRSVLRAVQTPQTFKSGLILKAFEVDYDASFTDEASVIERQGGAVHLTEGEESNVKITYPTDLLVAEKILELRKRIAQ